VILKLPEGMTLEQGLELPEEESDEVFFSGALGVLIASPGAQAGARLTADLTAGSYGLLCTFESADGPHFIQGMLATLVVNP